MSKFKDMSIEELNKALENPRESGLTLGAAMEILKIAEAMKKQLKHYKNRNIRSLHFGVRLKAYFLSALFM